MDAPLGSRGFEETGELKRLQRRAYGPGADIAGDVAAQARLSELEAAQRRPTSPVIEGAASLGAPGPESDPVVEPVVGSDPARASDTEPVDGAVDEHEQVAGPVPAPDLPEGRIAGRDPNGKGPAPPWWRRRWFAILGGAIAILALDAALVAWFSLMLGQEAVPVPTGTSAVNVPSVPEGVRPDDPSEPDLVLALESVGSAADQPNDKHGTLDRLGIGTDQLRRYDDFERLNVWSGPSRYGLECLFVAVPGQGLREGFGAEGCSPDGLDTVADLEYPSGRLIRFVVRGDHVDVYRYVRISDETVDEIHAEAERGHGAGVVERD